jgi:hypothetical protein
MTSEQRPADEIFNLLTHVLGFLLSLVATFLLMAIVMARGELRTILACGVYCLTLVLLYGASALSHAFHDLGLRRMFRTMDQACIYLLIAGSMTPSGAAWPTFMHDNARVGATDHQLAAPLAGRRLDLRHARSARDGLGRPARRADRRAW